MEQQKSWISQSLQHLLSQSSPHLSTEAASKKSFSELLYLNKKQPVSCARLISSLTSCNLQNYQIWSSQNWSITSGHCRQALIVQQPLKYTTTISMEPKCGTMPWRMVFLTLWLALTSTTRPKMALIPLSSALAWQIWSLDKSEHTTQNHILENLYSLMFVVCGTRAMLKVNDAQRQISS